MDPAMAQGGMPMDPGMGGAMDPNQIASIVMDSISTVLDEKLASIEKREATLLKKLDTLQATIDAMQIDSDRRMAEETGDEDLSAELDRELNAPVAEVPAPEAMVMPPQAAVKTASVQRKVTANNLFAYIKGN